jgi:putative tricarboxylic transport membrane protein
MQHLPLPRRAALTLPAILPAFGPVAAAAAPLERLTLIAPGPQGGGFDRMARAVAAALRETGGLVAGEIVIENRGVAGGAGALPMLLEASRGRGEVAMVTGAVMLGVLAMAGTAGELLRATPLIRLTAEPLVLAVPAHTDAPAALPALLARAGTLVIAGGPVGSPDHRLAVALASGRSLLYRAFPGGIPAAEAVLAGRVPAVLTNLSDLAPMLEDGRLRAIARAEPGAPAGDLPATDGNWRGLVAPPALADTDRERLLAMAAGLAAGAAWRAELARRGWVPTVLAGAAFGAFLTEEARRLEIERPLLTLPPQ